MRVGISLDIIMLKDINSKKAHHVSERRRVAGLRVERSLARYSFKQTPDTALRKRLKAIATVWLSHRLAVNNFMPVIQLFLDGTHGKSTTGDSPVRDSQEKCAKTTAPDLQNLHA